MVQGMVLGWSTPRGCSLLRCGITRDCGGLCEILCHKSCFKGHIGEGFGPAIRGGILGELKYIVAKGFKTVDGVWPLIDKVKSKMA